MTTPTADKQDSVTITIGRPHKALWPNGRAHWRAVAKAKADARNAAYLFGVNAVSWPKPPRWPAATVTITYRWGKGRSQKPDPDNLIASLKATLDGLADAGIYTNDRDLTIMPVVYAKDGSEPSVTLTITPTADGR